jgi:thioesterase domain-containing protein
MAESRGGTRQYDPLVPLQVTGSKTPLFCVHPGTGEILVFVSLASYFINERPFYALRARGFNEGEEYLTSMDEMVATYVEAIRKRQPHGPYALAGYSFGAPVAFEIAKVLEAQSERVVFVGVIDEPPWIGDPANPLDFIGLTVNVSFFLSLISRQQLDELPAQIRAAGEDACTYIVRVAPAKRIAELKLDLPKFKAWVKLAYALADFGQKYQATGSVESVTVFYAEPLRGTKAQWRERLGCWDEFVRTLVRYIEVRGEHHSLLDLPHLASFQDTLRAELDRALDGQ